MGIAAKKLDIESPQAADAGGQLSYTRATSTLGVASARAQTGYSERRQQQWNNPKNEPLLGTVAHLPLDLQVAFRRKTLSIFAIQLFFVTVIVAAMEHISSLKDASKSALEGRHAFIAVPSIAVLVLLFALYKMRTYFPWNWVCLAAFSIAQSFLFVWLGVIFETNVGAVNCGATFVWVLIMIGLSGVTWKKAGQVTLLHTLVTGSIGYVIVAAALGGIYAAAGDDFVTSLGLLGTLLFQLVLLLWFSYDASSMYKIMTPDEYMRGVIYFYSDLVLLLAVCVMMVAGSPHYVGGGGGLVTNPFDGASSAPADENA